MKKLILINGTMGVGKTTTCNELIKILNPSVYLDGDWCWNMNPFIVTEETKKIVQDNIRYLLRNFLSCSSYKYVLFSWVMHQEKILNNIINTLDGIEFQLYKFSLVCSEQALEKRLSIDVNLGLRNEEIIDRSLERLEMYQDMGTFKIDVSSITPLQAAEQIKQIVGEIDNEDNSCR